VIGGDQDGLTAAAYLGKAGLKVLVLERRAVLRGVVSGASGRNAAMRVLEYARRGR